MPALQPIKPLKILIADDEPSIRRILETRLRLIGYEVTSAENGVKALELFRSFDPNLVILDVMMPELDGFAVIEQIRSTSDLPIIMLTALNDTADRITGLQLGADDYMVKPFSPKELEARIRCVMRRAEAGDAVAGTSPEPSSIFHINAIRLDFNRRQAFKGDARIRLTGMEFSMLELLVRRAGQAIPRLELLEAIWGCRPLRASDGRVVDVHISRLRSKLEENPEQPELILTARGTGYMFVRLPNGQQTAA